MRTGFVRVMVMCAASVAAALAVPSVASADSCDPAIAACPNEGPQPSVSNPSLAFSPTTIASDDQYPFDGDWYFNNGDIGPHHNVGGGGGGGGHGR